MKDRLQLKVAFLTKLNFALKEMTQIVSPKSLKILLKLDQFACYNSVCTKQSHTKKIPKKYGSPSKLVGSLTKNGYLKIVQRGTLWVGRGSNP